MDGASGSGYVRVIAGSFRMDEEKTTTAFSTFRLVVRAEDAGKRIDVLLAERVPELSRRRARVLVSGGSVSIDGHRVLVQSRPVRAGQEVACVENPFVAAHRDALDPSQILHEDASLVAVDKPAGMPSHPTFARKQGTALQLLEEHLRRRTGAKVPLHPLHRLDAATSGVLLFAKSARAARAASQAFARRRVSKTYLAVVAGAPEPPDGEIALALGEGHLRSEISAQGKQARTRYRTVERLRDAALLELDPETGRMHQLRVHLAAIGHPIAGDVKYGDPGRGARRLLLHAAAIELPHPEGGAPLSIRSPLPEDFLAELAARRDAAPGTGPDPGLDPPPGPGRPAPST